jgi:hypothetical protein
VRELSAELPAVPALRELRRLGFTTIVVHHPPQRAYAQLLHGVLESFDLRTQGRFLEKLHGTESMTAYAIRAVAAAPNAGGDPADSARLPASRE